MRKFSEKKVNNINNNVGQSVVKQIGLHLICLLVMFFIFGKTAKAQQVEQKHTVYGMITNKVSGEALPYATILEVTKKRVKISNDYGFYSIKLSSKEISLVYSYIGYESLTININLERDTMLNIALQPSIELLDEVLVSNPDKSEVFREQISSQSIPVKKAKQLPVILGEVDLLKTVQLMPGVQSGHEGSSGIYVRGGSGDQNLFIIDGTPVYNVMHLFGFVSVFNEDAVSTMNIYTGSFPASYHGRLSSVIDIKTNEGSLYKYEGGISIGLLAAKFNINGPIKKDKGSFFISGRRSYFDLLARPFIKELADGSVIKLNYFDLNAKINYKISKRDHVFFSAYMGKDIYGKTFDQKQDIDGFETELLNKDELKWGNFVSSLRWNRIWNNKLFSKFIISYTNFSYINDKVYKNVSNNSTEEYSYIFNSGINDISAQLSFNYYPTKNHDVKIGIGYTNHTFSPGVTLEYYSTGGINNFQRDTTFGNKNIHLPEFNFYMEDIWRVNDKFQIRPGIALVFLKTADKDFISIEPRLSVYYALNNNLSLKVGYARMRQFMHMLRFSTINLPTDLWIPASKELAPELSDQFNIGVFYNCNDAFDFSVEAYYKNMKNLTEYKEGANIFSGNSSFENYIEAGIGWSYGIELMLKKKSGRLNGWISYTLSKSERKFTNINFGNPFPFQFDRRHDLSIVGIYKINSKINFGLTWVYGSGYPVTMHTDKYASYFLSSSNGNSVTTPNVFGDIDYYPYRNNYRMPAFHHLDLNFNFHKKTKYGERILSAGVYNVYNRLNAFYLKEKDGKLYKVSLFPIMPFISLTLKFY